MTQVVKLRWDHISNAGHSRVTVFVGPDAHHLANAGALALRCAEAVAFRRSLRMGTGQAGVEDAFTGFLESGWPGEDETE